jgi:hypothetical protein
MIVEGQPTLHERVTFFVAWGKLLSQLCQFTLLPSHIPSRIIVFLGATSFLGAQSIINTSL